MSGAVSGATDRAIDRSVGSVHQSVQVGNDAVGRSVPHDSAIGHVTGGAAYIEDLPTVAGELYVHFAGSPVAAGKIRNVNLDAAAAMPGVVAIITHRDIGGVNAFGPIFHNELFLAIDEVSYVGQPVVIIAAESRSIAYAAAAAVRIEVEPVEPVFRIEEAARREDLIGPIRKIRRGDPETAMQTAPHRIEGVFRSGGQEQFYFESQSCLTVPDEEGSLHVHSSTQHPTEIQAFVAEVLGLPMHQVVCVCRRMGGAFGGKESQSAIPAMMTAIVAQKTGRPARLVYDKHTDMRVTGKRHPYRTQYHVGFDNDGLIQSIKLDFFSDGGAFADLSTAVMERTMMHCDNAYYLPHVNITGRVCRTNYPPNTAFRGFGGPQAIVVIENIMEMIAAELGIDAVEVRRRNLYVDGDHRRNQTPYGQIVDCHLLPEIFDQIRATSDYDARVQRIEQFNADSRTHVRGIAMTGIKFGISFTTKFLNQGNALVNVYTDGSVQVSTGGTEMGQGLNTKIRQLVASEFGLPVDRVRVMPTSTEKNNNTSPTAASAGTDLNGSAAVLACQSIRDRLAKFVITLVDADAEPAVDEVPKMREDGSGISAAGDADGVDDPVEDDRWQSVRFAAGEVRFDHDNQSFRMPSGELCDLARRNRIDLGQRSFYATPGVEFDREAGRGTPFHYYTTGAAVSEVLIDRYTGDIVVERSDLLMDIGQRINPGIDDGQVIGGFVQGMGWCTTEALIYDDGGNLLSNGPTTYKIPGITDIPRQFNVDYIDNPRHKKNVRLSKAVGEPPLMLGISVWAAVKNAMIRFARRRGVAAGEVILDLPATGEETLMCMERIEEGAKVIG